METPPPFLRENGLEDLLEKRFWAGLREYGVRHEPFRAEAFAHFSERGGYPSVHRNKDTDFSILADHLNETVIKRVIQHDLRIGERGRKRDQNLLEELFRLACRFAGQTPRTSTLAEEARFSLGANIGTQRVTHYLKFLGDTRDTLGLRSFLEKSVNNAPFGLLVTQDDSGTVDDPRIVSMPLSTFMMLR